MGDMDLVTVKLSGPDGEPSGYGYEPDTVPAGRETTASFEYDGPPVDVERVEYYRNGERVGTKELEQTLVFGETDADFPLVALEVVVRPEEHGGAP